MQKKQKKEERKTNRKKDRQIEDITGQFTIQGKKVRFLLLIMECKEQKNLKSNGWNNKWKDIERQDFTDSKRNRHNG